MKNKRLVMFDDKAYHLKAKTLDGRKVFGAVKRFYNEDKHEEVFLMLHADRYGRPMISNIDLKTLRGCK